jgi:hypothetical protein
MNSTDLQNHYNSKHQVEQGIGEISLGMSADVVGMGQ